MKKINATAVFVVLMVSATNVFADATCADIIGAVGESKTSIAQSKENIRQLDEHIIQLNVKTINNQNQNKDESFIVGGSQPHLQTASFQAAKARSYNEESIRFEEAKIQTLTAEYKEKCSSFDQFE